MHLASVAFALVVLASGALFNFRELNFRSELTQDIQPKVESATDVNIEENVIDNSESDLKFTLSDFIYQNSSIIFQSDSEVILESSDDPEKITNWYQEKIKQNGFNIKNFVKTKVNGVVENKLSGANGENEINIEITSSGDKTNISVTAN